MTHAPSPPPPRRSSAGRVTAVVVGSVLALVSLTSLAVGGAAVWAEGEKDDQGYVSTGTDRFHTATAAVRTENLDVDLDGLDAVVDPDRYGKVRVRVEPRAGKDLFVGIAPTREVSSYLHGTAHATVTDLDYEPFHAQYDTTGGERRAAPPALQRFWAVSANGPGPQTLTWDVADGDWSVVVMNADGSPGVDAGVRAGASAPFLDEVAWGALGTGGVLLLVSGGLLFAGLREPRPRRADTGTPGPVPAAA
jgi:hypothetical protein